VESQEALAGEVETVVGLQLAVGDVDVDRLLGAALYAEAHRSWWPLPRDPLFLESSQPGLFVAGDVRHGSIKRVASAVGEGATSIALVHSYLAALDEDRQ
jgi:NADPH-dependent glutamate synthase beta subunit-like oxidoreductase